MTSGYIGSPTGNVIVPVTNFTKQTEWLDIKAYVTSNFSNLESCPRATKSN